jgi:hypothetical protein
MAAVEPLVSQSQETSLMGDTKYSEDVRRRAEQHYANLQKRMGKRVKQIIAGWSLDPNQYASVFTEAMEDNSDRAAAITIFALFDDRLLKVMQEHFDPDIPGGFDSIFHPSAFLGTAHNRLKLALALRWVEKTTYQASQYQKPFCPSYRGQNFRRRANSGLHHVLERERSG